MIVGLGAGLAGLALGAELERPFVLLEQEQEAGGLARSAEAGRFRFDLCGHVLHLRDPALRAWIEGLLPEPLVSHQRRAAIYVFERFVDYPFQMHLGQLPVDVAAECLAGQLEAHESRKHRNASEPESFRSWAEATFGAGITRHFLGPHNEKLHGVPLDELLADEVQWAVPVPSAQQVVRGALGLPNPSIGYNARFEYPRACGIGALPQALAREIVRRGRGRIELGARARAIDLAARRVELTDGRSFGFETLVSTIPLAALVPLIRDAPDAIRALAAGLRAAAVACVNLGFARPDACDRHWIYTPEASIPFHRVGCYSAFAAAPGSSFWVEFARPAHAPLPRDLPELALGGLRRLGLVGAVEEPEAVQVSDLRCAYVVHDAARKRALPALRAWLDERGVRCLGRYGEWSYGSMGDALASGRALAAELDAR